MLIILGNGIISLANILSFHNMQSSPSMQKSVFRFNIFYLSFMVLWPLLQVEFFGGFDGAGRIGWFLMTLACFVNGKSMFQVPKIMLIWGVWILYNVILCQIKGFNMGIPFPIWATNSLIKPFITMLVAYNAFRQDSGKTVKLLFYCWFVFVALGLATMQGHTRDVMGEDIIRQNNEMGNHFINASVFLLMFALYARNKGLIKINIFIVACLIEIIAIVLSGSRKGMLSIFIIFFMSYVGKKADMSMKQMIRIGFIAMITYLLVKTIMTYTVTGLRILADYEKHKYEDNWFLSNMGDRAFMYDCGWKLFLENPLTGIGLQNFRLQNALGIDLALHTEYMVQICECGLIGSVLFLIFYYGMAKRIVLLLNSGANKQGTFVLLATFVAFLIMSFFTWTYSGIYYFIFFGFIYAVYDNNKSLNIHNSKYGKNIIGNRNNLWRFSENDNSLWKDF